MADNVIAAYGAAALYPPNLKSNTKDLLSAGWTHLFLNSFHINKDGDIFFNDTAIIIQGLYVADYRWVSGLEALTAPANGSPIKLAASFGGGGVGDFGNVLAIYNSGGASFHNTNLATNMTVFQEKLGSVISIIDMDVEEDYNQVSFVAFCAMLIDLEFKLTFCPYDSTQADFWTGSLEALQSPKGNPVIWWNLQCPRHSSNTPSQWSGYITAAMPKFSTTGYIIAEDVAEAANETGDVPSQVQSWLTNFANEDCVGGAFIWNLDKMLDYVADPTPVYAMDLYVNAIKGALGSST